MKRSREFSHRAIAGAVTMLSLLSLACLAASCTGDVCGDLWEDSPSQLLSENEYVLLARFEGSDTLVDLGTMDYLGTPADFAVLSYRFLPVRVLKGPREVRRLVLWNCEYSEPTYTTILSFNTGDTVLLYGRQLQSEDSLLQVMAPMTNVSHVLQVLSGQEPKLNSNTRAVDSTLGAAIIASDVLVKQLMIQQQADTAVVLYCPEPYCTTMDNYHYGMLCYYDSANVGHSVTSEEYLGELEKLTTASE